MEQVRRTEAERVPGADALTAAVARNYHKLLAYKDEYEVARLFVDSGFLERIKEMFEGDWKLRFHLSPPLTAAPDPLTGEPRKSAYGPWMLGVFRLLARLKRLRGTWLDPFARTAERRLERRLIADYEVLLEELLAGLTPENHATAVELASIPDRIRGFGPVKERFLNHAKAREAELLAAFRQRLAPPTRQGKRALDVAVLAG